MSIFNIMKRLVTLQKNIEKSNFKTKENRREKIIRIRVTDEEKEAFELLGKSMGMSGMIRHAVLDLYLNDFIKKYD